jgi:hypothetical protein
MLKAAYSTRGVPKCAMKTLLTGTIRPKTGDLVLAQIINAHQDIRIELASGVHVALNKDDFVILCFDSRNVPVHFEACIPATLEPCHLLSASGIAAKLKSKISTPLFPADIKPIGIVGDDLRRPLNIKDWAIAPH